MARGIGLSAFVSIGNKADISSNDLLEWWEDDEATSPRAALRGVLRQPAPVRHARAAHCAEQADPRREERHDRRRGASRELSYRRVGGLGSGGRRALPPRRRHPGGVPRGADRCRGASVVATHATRSAGRGPDERGWPRDPLRRCVRGGRAGASATRRRDRPRAGSGPACRGERREPRRHARLGDGCVLSRVAAGLACRPRNRRRDRALRSRGQRDCWRRGRRGRGRERRRRPATSRSWLWS